LNISPLIKYDRFVDMGFNAGIIIRGPWNTQGSLYSKLESDVGATGNRVIAPVQLHGSDIIFLDNLDFEEKINADGVLCRNCKCCLTVKTADCLPVILADPVIGLMGAIHIGWRGLAGGILENLFIAIKNLDTDFDRLYISMGPSIGSCCFEVGGEVAVLFDDNFVMKKNDRFFLDIKGLVKKRMLLFGIPENKISDVAECTSCNADKYYSYRRDGHARIQMVSFICRT